MKRLFLALWPYDEVRQILRQLNCELFMPGSKPVTPANFHVTLVFIGSVTELMANEINQQLAKVAAKPLQLKFDELSYWRKPKVMCLTSTQLASEVIQLEQSLSRIIADFGVALDTRAFRPHITLARHVYRKPEVEFKPIVWQSEAFCLVESVTKPQGPRYKVIRTYPFCKS